ncbi:MAG: hypothetical protein V7K27_03200 [Nostoc sp.]|uniref:hypothetical protein n=1 Tax=Nostoc sp. TaxID=1180 RepID=UPI002FF45D99
MKETVTLYRPTGPKELELVKQNDYTKWPPRLPEQPIFYPVTNEEYAQEIATKWNVMDSGVGYVTRFSVVMLQKNCFVGWRLCVTQHPDICWVTLRSTQPTSKSNALF